MRPGELRSQIDGIWNSFWSGGISNPLEVIEQLTYLLFLKRLDDLQTLDENRANRLGEPVTRVIFPGGRDDKGRLYDDYRWRRFKNMAPAEMFTVVGDHVFPFLRTLGGEGSTYATHMRDARFTIPSPGLLQTAVDGLDKVPMVDRDTTGDVYEYMLSKIAVPEAGRHQRGLLDTSVVIDMEMLDPSQLPVQVAISALTMAELAAGPHATSDPEERGRRQDRLRRAEAPFDPLPFDTDAARAYGRVFSAVTATGRKARGARAVHLLIAATALAAGLPLYTRNGDDFLALDDLVEVVVL